MGLRQRYTCPCVLVPPAPGLMQPTCSDAPVFSLPLALRRQAPPPTSHPFQLQNVKM